MLQQFGVRIRNVRRLMEGNRQLRNRIILIPAQLLRQSHIGGWRVQDRHLLKATDRRRRGDYIRLQVPHRGREDRVPLWSEKLQKVPKLISLGGQVPAAGYMKIGIG